MRGWLEWSLITLLLTLGCSRTVADVEETYRPDARRAKSRSSTIVFVPGIMGSELVDSVDNQQVWGWFENRRNSETEVYDIALPFADGPPVSQLRDEIVPHGELLFAHIELGRTSVQARSYPGVLEGLLDALVAEGRHPVMLQPASRTHAPSSERSTVLRFRQTAFACIRS